MTSILTSILIGIEGVDYSGQITVGVHLLDRLQHLLSVLIALAEVIAHHFVENIEKL